MQAHEYIQRDSMYALTCKHIGACTPMKGSIWFNLTSDMKLQSIETSKNKYGEKSLSSHLGAKKNLVAFTG